MPYVWLHRIISDTLNRVEGNLKGEYLAWITPLNKDLTYSE